MFFNGKTEKFRCGCTLFQLSSSDCGITYISHVSSHLTHVDCFQITHSIFVLGQKKIWSINYHADDVENAGQLP